MDTLDISTGTQADVAAPPAGAELFGSFWLDGAEFALPASCIREVVNFPGQVTALPLSPAYLEGVFNLRGSVVPIVNLGRLFDPAAPAAAAGHMVAIIDLRQVLVGVVFHAIGEILRVRPEQRSAMRYADAERRGADADGGAPFAGPERRGVVAGAILLDGGARLLQILAAEALIRIDNVPQTMALRAAHQQREGARLRSARGERRQCVSFRAGGALFAFEMGAVREIVRAPALQRSALDGPLAKGSLPFRGERIAVVDLAALLNAPAGQGEQRVAVVRIGDASIGFLVDSVDHIVSFAPEELLPMPLLGTARGAMFAGCISQPGVGEILLLDHGRIFTPDEAQDLRGGHAPVAVAPAQGRPVRRQVYVAFTLEHGFALDILQLREIIDNDGALTKAPGMPAYLRGVLNLRQRMVGVIDVRALYGMAPLPAGQGGKILIVDRGEERYGLLVDAVDTILTIPDRQRFAAPKLMRNPASADPRAEMADMVEVDGPDGARRTLSVFDCDALLRRLAQPSQAAA